MAFHLTYSLGFPRYDRMGWAISRCRSNASRQFRYVEIGMAEILYVGYLDKRCTGDVVV